LAENDDNVRMALLNKVIGLDPKLARAFYNRGVLYMNKGDLTRAKSDFQKAVQLDEKYINAHYNLACVLSLDLQFDAALKSLENALDKGYRKFDKIPKDPDLENLKDKPAFSRLIAKYQAKASKTELNALQKIQTSDVSERGKLLLAALRAPEKPAPEVALWAMQEPDYQIRVLAMELWRKVDGTRAKLALLRGLYDVNGYVSKAAADALVKEGKTIEHLMIWTLEDKGAQGPFYAVQVLSGIDARGSTEKIAPLLRDEDPKLRMMAAESLARLRAVSALPQIEAALKNVPKAERERELYGAALGQAIARLKEIKEGTKK
jgi:tetratricopeptide (TPR) repeat protein